jgi:hypothetical protein
MTARHASRGLARTGGTAGSAREPPSPSRSRQTEVGRARHFGRGGGDLSRNWVPDP